MQDTADTSVTDRANFRTTICDEWRAAVTLRGELDAVEAPRLRAALAQHLDAGRRVLRVDVGDVSFIDSTALGELIFASECCRGDRGSLILTRVPPRLERLIRILGLQAVLLVDTAAEHPA
jgi:anti-sigma B factor antagonist